MINLFGSPAGRAINETTSTAKTCAAIASSTMHATNVSHSASTIATVATAPATSPPVIPIDSSQTVSTIASAAVKQMPNRSYENIRLPHNDIHRLCNSTMVDEKSKKNLKFKSNVIAKKAKFWKFLEEDKWKKNSVEDLSTSSSGKNRFVFYKFKKKIIDW